MNHPSAWPHRFWMLGFCAVGAAIAAYLTAVQLHWIVTAWDPIFGQGSEKVLFSALSRGLPIPDASAGLLAYVLEGALTAVGGESRWRDHPTLVLTSTVIIAAAGTASLGLVGVQIFVVRAGCFLCLISAAISIGLCVLAAPEASMAWRRKRA